MLEGVATEQDLDKIVSIAGVCLVEGTHELDSSTILRVVSGTGSMI